MELAIENDRSPRCGDHNQHRAREVLALLHSGGVVRLHSLQFTSVTRKKRVMLRIVKVKSAPTPAFFRRTRENFSSRIARVSERGFTPETHHDSESLKAE